MTSIIEQLDELDSLVKQARRSKMSPETFVEALQTARARVCELKGDNPPPDFLDAESMLTKAILDYEENPDLDGVGRIENALVPFRRTALSKTGT